MLYLLLMCYKIMSYVKGFYKILYVIKNLYMLQSAVKMENSYYISRCFLSRTIHCKIAYFVIGCK